MSSSRSPSFLAAFLLALSTARAPLASAQSHLAPLGFPDIVIDPASLGIDVAAGTSATTSFLVRNVGDGVLAVQAIEDDALWLTEDPAVFTVPPSGAQNVTVTVHAAALAPGVYNQTISISCNDPDEPSVTVPIRVNVTGASVPDIWVRPTTIEVTLPAGQTGTAYFSVGNNGGAALIVSSVTADAQWLSVTPSSFTVASGDSQIVTIQILGSPAPGTYTARVSVVSNDPDEPTVTVQVTEIMGSSPAECQAGLSLAAPSPNPFADQTWIRFVLSRPGEVTVSVHDVAGRLTTRIAHGWREQGRHAVRWNGTDSSGRRCAPGVYEVRLRFDREGQAVKAILIR